MAKSARARTPEVIDPGTVPTRQLIQEIKRCQRFCNGYVNHAAKSRDSRKTKRRYEAAVSRLKAFKPELRRRHPNHYLVKSN